MSYFLERLLFGTAFVSLGLSLFWAFRCRRDILRVGQEAGPGTFYLLAAFFCLAVLVRLLCSTPKHLLFNDEFYHMICAKNLVQFGHFGYFVKAPGWSLLIAGMFVLFGLHNYTAIGTTLFFGALSVVSVFFLVFLILKNRRIALWSALAFVLMPDHVFWSTTAETNVASLFFVTCATASMLLYFRRPARELLWLCLMIIAFSAHLRPENGFLFVLLVLGEKLYLKSRPRLAPAPWLAAVALSLPLLFYASGYHHQYLLGQAASPFLSVLEWFPKLFDASLYPWVFIVLFLAGFFYGRRRYPASHAFILLWFLSLCLIYGYNWEGITSSPSPFWAKTRFYIGLYPPLVVWFGTGALFVTSLARKAETQGRIFWTIVLVLLLSLTFYFRGFEEKRELTSAHVLETEILAVAERDLPPACMVVTVSPEVVAATTNLLVADMKLFIEDPAYRNAMMAQSGCVLFFDDYQASRSKSGAEAMKRLFRLVPFKRYALGGEQALLCPWHLSYTFYRVLGLQDNEG
jgi:4-amino-4-deoxy-L-arabinose transferase-like glycosyltransferase